MADVVRVFYRASALPTRHALARFIREGCCFVGPVFEPSPADPRSDQMDWVHFEVRQVASAFAVHLEVDERTAVAQSVEELRFVLSASRSSRGRDRLDQHLATTRGSLTIRVDAETLVDEGRDRTNITTIVACVAAVVARSCDGVSELPGAPGRSNYFCDGQGKRFHRL